MELLFALFFKAVLLLNVVGLFIGIGYRIVKSMGEYQPQPLGNRAKIPVFITRISYYSSVISIVWFLIIAILLLLYVTSSYANPYPGEILLFARRHPRLMISLFLVGLPSFAFLEGHPIIRKK